MQKGVMPTIILLYDCMYRGLQHRAVRGRHLLMFPVHVCKFSSQDGPANEKEKICWSTLVM